MAGIEVQMFKLAQMENRMPNAQFTTSAPFWQTLIGSSFGQRLSTAK
jgi:hypothetical protein